MTSRVLLLLVITISAGSTVWAQSGTRLRKYAQRRPTTTLTKPPVAAPLANDVNSADEAEPVVMLIQAKEATVESSDAADKVDPKLVEGLLPDRDPMALEGNDPVMLIESGNLVAGQPIITSSYDGQTYQFSSEDTKARFDSNPTGFAPVLAGDSIVRWMDSKILTPGKLPHFTVYGGAIYLFRNAEEKQKFDTDAKLYADADLLLQGFSPVSLVDDETLRRGNKDFTVKKEGFRLFLVDADEVEKFNAETGKYFPTLGGIDPVSVAAAAPAVGLARYAVVYKNRLYAMASSENREKFIVAPGPYSDLDVAEGGNDPVIATDDRQQQLGHYGISAIYHGRRYLFASEANRLKFLESPSSYVRP